MRTSQETKGSPKVVALGDFARPSDRRCRHMVSGRLSYRFCQSGFDCAKCEFHQMLEDAAEGIVFDPATGFRLAATGGEAVV